MSMLVWMRSALYIEVAPQSQANADPDEDSGADRSSNSDLDGYDTDSDTEFDDPDSSDDEECEVDEMVEDSVPPHIAEVVYDKDDLPMEVGSIYPNMHAFKVALASHAIKNEFEYDMEKSEPGRYRAHCSGRTDGCKWRIHASTMSDKVTVKVKRNPCGHDCNNTRRTGKVKGATKYWVCEKVKDWLVEDRRLGATEFQRRIKDRYKVVIHYKKVYHGKELALTELYGDWKGSFNNLYRFKAAIEDSCPGSFVVIDHHTINKKITFNRLFFCIETLH